jgi:hypothetical protein
VPRRLSACQQGRRPIADGPVSTAARAAAEDNGEVLAAPLVKPTRGTSLAVK